MEYDNNNKGSLWNKVSAKGIKYCSGTATLNDIEYKVSMFINDKKGNEKRPDFNLVFEEAKKQEEDPYKEFGKEITPEDFPF